MTDYRRLRVAGATYFFTVALADRRGDLLTRHVTSLRGSVRAVKARMPFHIDAWVVLPEHMHCLWTLPQDDTDYPARWRAIKGGFSKQVPIFEPRSASRASRNERGIWQRRYWEHMIRDEADYASHADYIHFNPVRHGLVETPSKWQFSSFHRWVSCGWYPPAWGGRDISLSAGERDDEIMPP